VTGRTIRVLAGDAARRRKRETPTGRQVQPATLAEVEAATAALPLRRELPIEHLHAIQDHFGQLGTAHLAALAQRLNLAQAEVFEVASSSRSLSDLSNDGGLQARRDRLNDFQCATFAL
jgi:formate dehydrogenase beta subunit